MGPNEPSDEERDDRPIGDLDPVQTREPSRVSPGWLHLPTGPAQRIAVVVGGALAITAGVAIAVITEPTRNAPEQLAANPSVVGVRPASSQPIPTFASSLPTPVTPPSGSPAARSPIPTALPALSAWSLPPGWRHDLSCEDAPCLLHLFDDAGREQDGWPVAVHGDCSGEVAVGPEGSAFVPCTRNGRAIVTGLGRDGSVLAGWPVSLQGSIGFSTWNDFAWGGGSSIAVGPDGAVFVAIDPPGRDAYRIAAFERDGAARRGWPRTLAGQVHGFSIAPDGVVVAWWYEDAEQELGLQARRTRFTMFDPTGETLPGWPIGSTGAASGPVVWRDGTIYYTSATGKVWGHDRTGKVVKGWPYQLSYPVPPTLRADGTLMFIGSNTVDVIDRQGKVRSGWPWRTRGTLDAPGCDTGDFSYPVFARAADDRLYVAPWDGSHSEVIALSSNGDVMSGWPYRVPEGWRVTGLQVGEEGSVSATLSGGGCFYGEFDATSTDLSADGRPVGDPPGTPLTRVYDALKPEGLRTIDGAASYPAGSAIGFTFDLVNRSKQPIVLPHVDYYGSEWYAAGSVQTWLERVGPDDAFDCIPGAGRKESWYATGGWIAVSDHPTTVQQGGAMPTQFDIGLSSDETSCLPPGGYRMHVEYKPLDGELDDVIAERSLAFTITGDGTASPTPTVVPTPMPTPTFRPTPRPAPTPASTTAPPAP